MAKEKKVKVVKEESKEKKVKETVNQFEIEVKLNGQSFKFASDSLDDVAQFVASLKPKRLLTNIGVNFKSEGKVKNSLVPFLRAKRAYSNQFAFNRLFKYITSNAR